MPDPNHYASSGIATPGSVAGTTHLPHSSSRTTSLERELAQLERINSTISRLISTIRTTHTNIDRMNESSNNTHVLLDQWIRILSQANFTHEIINNKAWDGETADIQQVDEDEKELVDELNAIEAENSVLRRQIEDREKESTEAESRREELANRRRRELGLTRDRVKRTRI